MKKSIITTCKVWLAAALFLIGMIAAPLPSYADGAFSVSGSYKENLPEAMDPSGVTFELFKVGGFDGPNLKLDFDAPVDLSISKDAYEDSDEGTAKWQEAWLEQAKIVAQYLPEGSEPAGTAATDANGDFAFAAPVENGLYLLISNDDPKIVDEGDQKFAWSPQPMLVMVLNDSVSLTIKPISEPIVKKHTVVKTWTDEGHGDVRPESIDVEIYYNFKAGEENEPVETVTLDADNNWSYSWESDKVNAEWTVKEVMTDDIEKNYSVTIVDNADAEADAATHNITNTYARYSLKLLKKMPTFLDVGEQVTPSMSFEVRGFDEAGEQVYYTLAGMSFTKAEAEKEIELKDIPRTVKSITVKELYAGGAYEVQGDNPKTAEFKEDEKGGGTYSVEFENKYSVPNYSGGAVNQYKKEDGVFKFSKRLGKVVEGK